MSTTLHWNMRKIVRYMRDDGRLAVYVLYLLHANVRNRAWPSLDLLMKESGWGRESLVDAKNWLVECNALEPVPYALRVAEERRHPRQDVMQITGYIDIDGERVPLLYTNENTNEEINSSVSELLIVRSPNGRVSEPEVNTNDLKLIPSISATQKSDTHKPTQAQQSHREMVAALVRVTGLEFVTNRGKFNRAAKELRDAGYGPANVELFGEQWPRIASARKVWPFPERPDIWQVLKYIGDVSEDDAVQGTNVSLASVRFAPVREDSLVYTDDAP